MVELSWSSTTQSPVAAVSDRSQFFGASNVSNGGDTAATEIKTDRACVRRIRRSNVLKSR